MTSERRSLIDQLVREALDRDGRARAAFLDGACIGDEDLRQEVEKLLDAHERGGRTAEATTSMMGMAGPGKQMRTEIGHYRIVEELGRGGMGVVYRAEDTRLKRHVALKFLSAELTRDEDAKLRFMREARAASSLDHPNLCTIYEIDETPGGELFLAMAFYEGETLRNRIHRGPTGLEEALDLAIQVAQGLRKAHESGIIHRDIKPSNLFITRDGIVKILDFGLAKLSGQTELTQPGLTLGTAAYMSPEQIRGETIDQRTDIWALGSVLYEMLAGQPAFRGENSMTVMHSVLQDDPRLLGVLRPELPARIGQIVHRALAKKPESRYASVAAMLDDLSGLRTSLAPHQPHDASNSRRFVRNPLFVVPAALLLLAILGILGWTWSRSANARWSREQAIPEVARLVRAGSYPEAFALAAQAARYVPDDPLLRTLQPEYASTFSIESSPSDAAVYFRPYESSEEWQLLGRTPLPQVRLPRRVLRWQVQKDGFEPADFATRSEEDRFPGLQSPVASYKVELQKVGKRPPEMVFIAAGGTFRLVGVARLNVGDLPPFFLDRNEVTNKEFKQFVDASGYQNVTYWRGLDFVIDGKPLSWEEAQKHFVDSTNRPGPSSWELGDYPDGQDDYPVAGVSWYEAMAYAQFRGKRLPTVYHWLKASVPELEPFSSLASAIVPLSNFGGTGPRPASSGRAMGPFGTYDMQGNMREWVSNKGPNGGWVLGGAWNDTGYYNKIPRQLSRFDRSSGNGFRLMRELESHPGPSALFEPIDLSPPRSPDPAPASDETFEAYRRQFVYTPAETTPPKPATVETTDDWTKQVVTLDTGYGEKMQVYLFIPKSSKPPYQTVVHFPGFNAFEVKASSNKIDPAYSPMPLDHIIRSGRALVQPVYQGSYERWQGAPGSNTGAFMRRVIDWRWDLGRTLDYLQAHEEEFDSKKMLYVGTSFGASYAVPLLAVETRFRGALLLSGGLGEVPVPPAVDPIHYLPRITLPVLLLNGRYDDVIPEPRQLKLFTLLGTPPENKQRIPFEDGHAFLSRKKYINETLRWLDKTLGATQQ